MRALVARQTRAEMIKGFNTCIEMEKNNARTPKPDPMRGQIKSKSPLLNQNARGEFP